jgi:lysophospholipase L1-like esterase
MSAPLRIERFAALGDSFTAGLGEGVPSWTDILVAALRRAEPDVSTLNLAAVGARASEVAEHQLAPAVAFQPTLVTVVCGANDVLLTPRPDVRAFRRSFAAILGRLRAETDAVVITVTYPGAGQFVRLRERSRQRVEGGFAAVNDAIRAEAERSGAVCLDFAGHPEERERANYAPDGFHPSAEGHRKAALGFMRGIHHHLGVDLATPDEIEEAA